MNKSISTVSIEEYEVLTEIWEASVRATHDFLKEEDITFLKPKILNDYLSLVNLRGFRDNNKQLLGFIGVADNKVEMLFVEPKNRGKGIGKQLLTYAVNEMSACELDVNEQNPQGLAFYLHMGFKVVGRSELDGLGKPFPLLHMRLA